MEMEWKKIASMDFGKIVFIPYHALLRSNSEAWYAANKNMRTFKGHAQLFQSRF